MVVPARNWAAVVKFRAGIGTYEKLGGVEDADRHEVWKNEEITAQEPHWRTDPYDHAVAYREYLTDDARLVVATLRAAAATGAVTANRLPVVDVHRNGDRVDGVVARCAATGREITVRGAVVVNAAGPWVESIARMEQDPPPTRLHLSKGVHVVVSRDRFPANHLVIANTADKRSIFVIPRGDVVYIGTTDTSYDGDRPLWPEVTREDVEYLLAPMSRYFDIEPLTPDDVIAAWAGVRPLIAQEGKEAKEMSRKDEVGTGPGGMISIAGGKLTGFRKLTEEVMDVVEKQLGRPLPEGPGTTPVPGGLPVDSDPDRLATRLRRLYGSEAPAVLALGAELLVDGAPVVSGEVDWAIDVEAATTLVDVVYRRTRIAWYVPHHREALALVIADRMASRLGWDNSVTAEQLAEVQAHFADELAFKETT